MKRKKYFSSYLTPVFIKKDKYNFKINFISTITYCFSQNYYYGQYVVKPNRRLLEPCKTSGPD